MAGQASVRLQHLWLTLDDQRQIEEVTPPRHVSSMPELLRHDLGRRLDPHGPPEQAPRLVGRIRQLVEATKSISPSGRMSFTDAARPSGGHALRAGRFLDGRDDELVGGHQGTRALKVQVTDSQGRSAMDAIGWRNGSCRGAFVPHAISSTAGENRRATDQRPKERTLSRRRNTSPAEDLLRLVALMPWWVGIALAIGSYFLLHQWAGQPVKATAQSGQVGTMVTETLWRTLASVGQYVLPLICLAAAGVSAWRRNERQQLVMDVGQSRTAAVLDGMSWQQFEKLVGEGFRLQGYRVAETGGGGADGGVDLVLTKGSEKSLVQCKQWRAFKVGVDVVRELYGVMAAHGATGGFVVTSGRFTDDAAAFAKGRNIQLWDGAQLHALIRRAEAGVASPPAPVEPALEPQHRPAVPAQHRTGEVPSCPVCAKPMVQRTAKRGASAGSAFWGCSGYPACRGTRPLA